VTSGALESVPKLIICFSEHTHLLHGKAKVVDECTVEVEQFKSKSSFCARVMTIPNSVLLVLLIVLGSIVGESALRKSNHHDDLVLTTHPDAITLVLGEKATVTYKYE
jgi:hypothetical protein